MGAQVSPGHPNGFVARNPATILRMDCLDAMKNAIHREAVPLLLPYVDSLDKVSWWMSQAVQFYLSAGCLAGYGAILGGYEEAMAPQHSAYPRGLNYTLIQKAVYAVVQPAGLVPWPITPAHVLHQGHCSNQSGAGVEELAVDRVYSSGNWMVSEPFLTCKAALKKRFKIFSGHSYQADVHGSLNVDPKVYTP